MTAYVYVIGKISEIDKLRKAYAFEDGEYLYTQHKDKGILYCSSNVTGEVDDNFNVFKGQAINYEAKEIIFGAKGHNKVPSISSFQEGCYFQAQFVSEDQIMCGADLFAQGSGVYSYTDSVFVMSNSFFHVVYIRSVLGLKSHINRSMINALSSGKPFTYQLVSHRTVVDEVCFAPPGTRIKVDLSGAGLGVFVVFSHLEELFSLKETDSHEGVVLEGAQRIKDLLYTLSSLPNSYMSLDLSGGLDSRVCFAGIIDSKVPRDKIKINSVLSRDEEARVIKMLADRYELNLNSPPFQVRAERVWQAPHFALHSLGIYSPLYSPRAVQSGGECSFKVGGHGAELIKGNYGWKTMRPFLARFPIRMKKDLQSYAVEGLKALGINNSNPFWSEWHYLAYRNAIHGNRSTMSTWLGMKPLMQRKIVALSRSRKNLFPKPEQYGWSIINDLLIALSPDLASLPFDDSKKNMREKDINRRKSVLGSCGEAFPYQIFGSHQDIDAGSVEGLNKPILSFFPNVDFKEQGFRDFVCNPSLKEMGKSLYSIDFKRLERKKGDSAIEYKEGVSLGHLAAVWFLKEMGCNMGFSRKTSWMQGVKKYLGY